MSRKIKKLVVANRGEIAVRIFRTLKRMGITGVAVYSDADRDAFHVRSADEKIRLAGNGLAETYLNVSQLITLAIEAGADAIHPGYGFLAESPVFAAEARKAGLVFIGPGEEAIRLMGNKVEARVLVEKLGIPVIKGATGNPKELFIQALHLGFPLLVKAAAGGGGKGMRIVVSENDLLDVLETTQREAFSYFGNGEVYIEKYLKDPRHIEVQVMADQHGNTVCLHERECSIQRRYQKIIEEAPSPSIGPELRKQLIDAAKSIATNIGYENAGTIEFLVVNDQFYFLEMNTRIQVEHPVTEMITGLDIVEEQLKIAMGLPLSVDQKSLCINGHAIEARVYAEDPASDFRPSPGTVSYYREPAATAVRIDSAIDGPATISSEFDPMISKVIVHANSRELARTTLIKTLMEYAIHGIKTNNAFLIKLLQSPSFIEGNTDTGFCDRFISSVTDAPGHENGSLLPLIAAFLLVGGHCTADGVEGLSKKGLTEDCRFRNSKLWHNMGYWRLLMNPSICIDEEVALVNIQSRASDEIVFGTQGGMVAFKVLKNDQNYMELESDGITFLLHHSYDDNGYLWVQHLGHVRRLGFKNQISENEVNTKIHNIGIAGNGSVNAPMHGKVIKINVSENEIVNKGDTLLILESMKMENRILAPGKARIKKIAVSTGEMVVNDASLVLLSDLL